MEKLQEYFNENPIWGGVLILAFGVMLLLASIFDWNWIFGDINTMNYNPRKIDGLINLFGRTPTRIFCGFLSFFIIGGGITWIWIYLRN